jgi:Flp pilus assembly protein TadG
MKKMPFSFWIRRRCTADERGAAAVEFALLAPLFFMLVFGMFSGGLLFNEKSQLTFAAREGARYGSALPLTQNFTGAVDAYSGTGCTTASSGGSNSGPLWACNVAKDAITAASGDLASTIPNVFVCVAMVKEGTANTVLTLSGSTYYYDTAAGATGTCFNDGGADQARRLHVLVRRNGSLNAVLFSMSITLTSQGIARAEQQT